ncbi:MAG: LamG domain-containing protein [Planctomycetota bacterium]
MTHRLTLHCFVASALAASAFAQNDECATAAPLALGSIAFDTTAATPSAPAWACALGGGPDVWYEFTAPQNARYTFETCGSSYDTSLEIFGGTCGTLALIACNDDACGVSSRVVVDGQSGMSYFLRIGGYNGATGFGTLTVTEVVQRPVNLVAHYTMDDTNGTCADSSGNNLSGSYLGGVQGVSGAAAGTGTAVDFDGLAEYVEITAQQPLDELLNDLSASCWFYLDGPSISNTNTSRLHRLFGNNGPNGSWSFGVDDTNGQVVFTTHGVLDYIFTAPIQLNRWYHIVAVMDWDNDVTMYLDGVSLGTVMGTNAANTPNGTYNIGAWWSTSATVPQFTNGKIDDVQVYGGALSATEALALFQNPGTTLSGGANPICCGYCTSNPNSTGQPGLIGADGSSAVAANNVRIRAFQLPNNSFGFFLTSLTQGFVTNPGGSQGDLCLSGSIGRYVGPGQIQNSGMIGEFSLQLDLTQHPTPTGIVSVVAGQNWNFQAWYRDAVNGVATSNFTNGRSITFN